MAITYCKCLKKMGIEYPCCNDVRLGDECLDCDPNADEVIE